MWLTGENPVQLVRIRDDAFGYADLSDGFLRLIVIEDAFERDFFRIADALLCDGGHFLDVGANHGLLSFGLASRWSDRVRFHLFEPNPDLHESIEESLKLYPSMQVEVNPVAVSDKTGTVLLRVDKTQTGASHIVQEHGQPVPCVTLDSYIEAQGIDQIELVKLDIEGHELTALRGTAGALEKRLIRAVYFEYFEKNLARTESPVALLRFLDEHAYEVCFCRHADQVWNGGASTLTLIDNSPGHGLPLVPVKGRQVPTMTDLLAVRREDLATLDKGLEAR